MYGKIRKGPQTLSRVALVVACTAAVGCATAAPTTRAASWGGHGIGVRSTSFFPMPDILASLTGLTWLPPRAPMAPAAGASIGGDRSVGAAGLLGQTTNEVVPIPGTDMIRVGFLQEGTFSASQFRAGAQEARDRGGAPGAVLIFQISRP